MCALLLLLVRTAGVEEYPSIPTDRQPRVTSGLSNFNALKIIIIIINTFVRFLMAHTTHWNTHVHIWRRHRTHTHTPPSMNPTLVIEGGVCVCVLCRGEF